MSEAPAASRSRPAATVQVPPSARTTLSWAASRVTDGVVVTKRSGQKRRSYRVTRRLVEPTRRASPGRADQGNNKPSTNRRPRHRDSNSRTKRVEFLCRQAYGPSGSSLRRRPVPFPPRLEANHSSPRAQSASESVTCRIADRHRALSHAPDVVKSWLPKPCLPLERPCPNPGLGRRDRGQTGSESATRRFARFGARKATAIGRWPKPSQIMAPKGLIDGGASQSIIAALRMQTMVACAGFSLRFLMRWGISQR